ncbi:MAG: ribokinase [Cereibacter sphaeroides]|uniref:Ribokinase n=1 Tax=Cereibacter sphaeroides TaxID=1063 RepID=A0A2W5S7L4_CERSP|nr:MAG: ribokinase [Cereibacter sphaeroides]
MSPVNPAVLVVGSLHYDIVVEADHLPRRDETGVGHRWFPKFGGKGGNQAVAVAKAGVPVTMLGAVGDDDFGRFLRAALDSAGVDHSKVRTVDSGSGMSVAISDAAGDYAATIVSGANLLIDPEWLSNLSWEGLSVLVLQSEVPEGINVTAARLARQNGIPVLLNAAPARPLSQEFAKLVDILVVNAIEAEMFGSGVVSNLPSAEAAARSLSMRFPTVVVTAGGAGLSYACGDKSGALAAEKVHVVSSHGAGDCFTGSLAACLARGENLEGGCRIASQAAARHVAGE